MIDLLALICLVMAAIPAGLTVINLVFYRPLRAAPAAAPLAISVLIPARNEEARITPVLFALMQNAGSDAEIIVGDDGSTDGTAGIVSQLSGRDARIRLLAHARVAMAWL